MQSTYFRKVSVVVGKLQNIFLILVLLLLTFLPQQFATIQTVKAHGDDGHSHGRFGHITWIAVDGDPANTARITFTAGFRRNAFPTCRNPVTGGSVACTGPGGLPGVGDVILETVGGTTINDFGDGTSIPTTLYFKVFSINTTDNWLMSRALQPSSATQEYISHTYPGVGPYTIVSESCCRTGALALPNAHINNPDKAYRFTAVADFSRTAASPISLLPPIVDCPLESACTFKVAAVDPDAIDPEDPNPSHLRWRLALPSEMGGSNLSQPPGASIDLTTGLYTWDTHGITLGPDGYNTLYSTQVIIEDRAVVGGGGSGELKSSVGVDFFIRVIDLPGPPVDDIRVPVRWCTLLGSPSLSDPNQSIEEILDQRLRHLSHRIYMPQAQMSFFSTPREAGYPTFANTDAHGNPGNGNFRAQFASLDLRRAISDCRLNWQATDPGAQGMIAINLRRFVDGSGNDTNTLFGVAMGPDWNERGIPGYQLVSGASVIDNTFLNDANQKWLGHEIGHAVSLTHTLDPNNIDPLQSQIVDHTGNIMNDADTLHDTIEDPQRTVIRIQALMIPGARQVGAPPPPGGGTRADTVSDTPGTEGFVNVDTTGIAISPDQSTTHFVTSTYGLFPQNASSLNYYFAADLDNQSSTGGSPSSVGAPYAAQGMDMVGLVQVNVVNDVAQGVPTVWKYQSGQFIQITDSRIETIIDRLYGTEAFALQTAAGPTPVAQVIQLLIPNDLLGSIATEVRLATIAKNLSTNTVDSVEGPIFLTSPTLPSCQINPDGALLGSTVSITASNLLANRSVNVYLGDQSIVSGSTDTNGNITLDATIPPTVETGTQIVYVHVVGTGVSAFCSVQLWATPKFDVPPSPADGTSFTAFVGETLEIPIQASDLDTETGDLVKLDVIGLPAGASFPIPPLANPASATFSWTPTSDQVGSYVVVFTAQDSLGLSATPLSVTITVTQQPTAIAITAGLRHTCALMADGGIKCWGDNTNGQLGDGTTTQRAIPVDVNGLTSGVTAISAGYFHTCALTSAGGVKCWGLNTNGQLGDGTTTQRTTPVNVSGLTSGVSAIFAGDYHTCALTSAGGVKCWGSNSFGQLGDGTTTQRTSPVNVSGLTSGVSAITAGTFHTCALTSAGGAKCWGSNSNGQLGDGTTTQRTTPVNVSGLTSGVGAISAGDNHTCARTSANGVKCWGYNFYGQLGDGTTTQRTTPVNVSGLTSGVKSISLGANHTCALTSTGAVKCWGLNADGQLGDGTIIQRTTPVNVSGLTSGVSTVSAGGYHTCALLTTNSLMCWGDNHYAQLGDGSIDYKPIPVDVSGLTSGVGATDTGYYQSCALTIAGGVKCWGSNEFGQLGDGTTTQRTTPANVSGLTSGVTAISVGGFHTCALTSAGGAKCWGNNSNGQLGDGTTTQRTSPVNVSGLTSGVTAISAGDYHTCALTTAGAVKCWGRNTNGQLGDGTTTQRTSPVNVSGLTSGVTAISAGANHTCALMSAGGVKCWGSNSNGQLGDGTTTQRTTPVNVSGLTSGVTVISTAGFYSCARTSAGAVKCWGSNAFGQLGDGTTTQRTTPVNVSGLTSGVKAISTGFYHGCAVMNAGGAKCWGSNSNGQLGDGTTTQRTTPVDVSGLTASAISAGYYHTCALTSAGGVKCWGWNNTGQIGDGSLGTVATPVLVLFP